MGSALGEVTIELVHGAQNRFALLDARKAPLPDYAGFAHHVCSPDEGLGIDGLLVIENAHGAAAGMRIFNADGSEAEMCGNGMRCVARYLFERSDAGTHFTVETLAGPIQCEIVQPAPDFAARIGLGAVRFPAGARDEQLNLDDESVTFVAVDTGNPHVVLFVDDVAAVDLETLGAQLARHSHFPGGTNVHAAQRIDAGTLRVRHYERGVGLTQACGTGTVASAAAAIVRGLVTSPVTVEVPGGRLIVEWAQGSGAFLTGPAERDGVLTLRP